MEALERVKARGGGRPQVNRQATIGRAGVTPQNWVGTHDEGRTTCDGREAGQSEPCPEGLSLRRGRGWSLVINTPILNMSHNSVIGGAGAEPFLPIPEPLENHPQAERCPKGPLRCSRTLPCCLRTNGWFPNPPPYTFHDPNAPHTMMACFLPAMSLFALCSGSGIAAPTMLIFLQSQ